MRRLMALLHFGRKPPLEKRMAQLEARGQLAVDRANGKLELAEARIRREQQQYNDRLLDKRTV